MSVSSRVSAIFGLVVFVAISAAALYTGQVWVLEYSLPLAFGAAVVLSRGFGH